jgi:hypothetical protein
VLIVKTLRFAVSIKAQVDKSNQPDLPLDKWAVDFYDFLWWEIKYG